MNSNNQLMGTYSCLLEKMVDNALENCSRCCSGTSPAESNKRHHKKHRCKRNNCCDCCDCDDECGEFEVECPLCGAEITVDEETVLNGAIPCPNCGEMLEFEIEEEAEEEE